jgi:hypothetical protein
MRQATSSFLNLIDALRLLKRRALELLAISIKLRQGPRVADKPILRVCFHSGLGCWYCFIRAQKPLQPTGRRSVMIHNAQHQPMNFLPPKRDGLNSSGRRKSTMFRGIELLDGTISQQRGYSAGPKTVVFVAGSSDTSLL